MAVNKVIYGETTVIDITDSTVTASKLKSGETAYGADGAKITGSLVVPEVLDDLTDVVITTPQTAQEIYYDGTEWINYGAKILLTFDDDFRGQTITLTKGQTTITKTAPLSGNTMNLYVNETGTWTISSTISGDTYETEVNVTTFGTSFDAELVIGETVPQGSTVTPTDDIQTWLACANLDKPYTTLEAVLADRETFETLIADSNACDYMARSTTWANDTTDDADAMALIGKYDYCSNALLGNATWAEAIADSDYFEEVLNVKVPVMTSATTPSGEVSASSAESSYPAWRAFDGSDSSNGWYPSTNSYANSYIQYKFTEPIKAYKMGYYMKDSSANINTIKIEGSNNGTDFTLIKDDVTFNSGSWKYDTFNNVNSYLYIRVTFKTNGITGSVKGLKLQFYGRASSEVLVPLVPTMTSNTTPSGEVLYGNMMTGSESYKAFDKNESNNTQGNTGTISTFYIGYDFGTPTVVNSLTLKASCYVATYYYKLKPQGYNGSEWVDIGTDELTVQSAMGSPQTLTLNLNNTTAYSKYRLLGTTTNTSGNAVYIVNVTQLYIYELQFYQRTVQTNIVHSCANDTIYYLEDNSPVIVATTNSDGDGILDFSSLEDKEYTFYSSVAKDPSNLSNDYSKTIRITKSEFGGTTEMYLMPDTVKTLYWFGYESDNLEDCTSANGWSVSGFTLVAPTHNTANISLSSASGQLKGVGTKSKVYLSSVKAIATGTTAVSGVFGVEAIATAKNISSLTKYVYYETSSISLVQLDADTSGEYNATFYATAGRNNTLHALWYE